MAFLVGELAGAFLACAGIGYLWIGALWLVGVRKRSPRVTYWSAAGLCVLLGIVTALAQTTAIQVVGYVLAGFAAAVFILWRGGRVPAAKLAAPGESVAAK